MGTQNELVQRLEDGYNKFSKGQKKLADFIREDYDKAAFMTAAKMGEEVGVSESTVDLQQLLDMKVILSFKGRLARWSVQNLIPFNEWK